MAAKHIHVAPAARCDAVRKNRRTCWHNALATRAHYRLMTNWWRFFYSCRFQREKAPKPHPAAINNRANTCYSTSGRPVLQPLTYVRLTAVACADERGAPPPPQGDYPFPKRITPSPPGEVFAPSCTWPLPCLRKAPRRPQDGSMWPQHFPRIPLTNSIH